MSHLESLPDPDHGICPECHGSGEIHFNLSSGGEPWHDNSQTCRNCLGDGWIGEVPVQEFRLGERVKCGAFYGHVREYIPQLHTDNLYVVDWDTDASDHDRYPAHHLCRATEAKAA